MNKLPGHGDLARPDLIKFQSIWRLKGRVNVEEKVGESLPSSNFQPSMTHNFHPKAPQIYFQGNIYHPVLKLLSVPLSTLKWLSICAKFFW